MATFLALIVIIILMCWYLPALLRKMMIGLLEDIEVLIGKEK